MNDYRIDPPDDDPEGDSRHWFNCQDCGRRCSQDVDDFEAHPTTQCPRCEEDMARAHNGYPADDERGHPF